MKDMRIGCVIGHATMAAAGLFAEWYGLRWWQAAIWLVAGSATSALITHVRER